MKADIILSGVGGQGILSMAAIIGGAALRAGLHIKQAEVHGMSQRGGDVQSNLRISPEPIHSDLIALGRADAIVSLEPLEALRYLPYLSSGGWVVANISPIVNIPDYPDHEKVLQELNMLPNVILIDAHALARYTGVSKAVNTLLLGAASVILDMDPAKLEESLKELFARKGEKIVETNLRAFSAGREAGKKQMKRRDG